MVIGIGVADLQLGGHALHPEHAHGHRGQVLADAHAVLVAVVDLRQRARRDGLGPHEVVLELGGDEVGHGVEHLLRRLVGAKLVGLLHRRGPQLVAHILVGHQEGGAFGHQMRVQRDLALGGVLVAADVFKQRHLVLSRAPLQREGFVVALAVQVIVELPLTAGDADLEAVTGRIAGPDHDVTQAHIAGIDHQIAVRAHVHPRRLRPHRVHRRRLAGPAEGEPRSQQQYQWDRRPEHAPF